MKTDALDCILKALTLNLTNPLEIQGCLPHISQVLASYSLQPISQAIPGLEGSAVIQAVYSLAPKAKEELEALKVAPKQSENTGQVDLTQAFAELTKRVESLEQNGKAPADENQPQTS